MGTSLHATRLVRLCLLALLLAGCVRSYALVTETVGPQPETEGQSWWQPGLVALARHPARVYARQSESAEIIYFDAAAAERRALLSLFAAVRARAPLVAVKPGPVATRTLADDTVAYTLALAIPDGVYAGLLQPSQPWPEPNLTVYVSDASPLDPMEIPEGVFVASSLPAYVSRVQAPPARKRYTVQLTDDAPTKALNGRRWILIQTRSDGPHYAAGLLVPGRPWTVWLSDAERAAVAAGTAPLVASEDIAVNEGDVLLPLRLEEGRDRDGP